MGLFVMFRLKCTISYIDTQKIIWPATGTTCCAGSRVGAVAGKKKVPRLQQNVKGSGCSFLKLTDVSDEVS